MSSSKMLESLSVKCFYLDVVLGFLAALAGQSEELHTYVLLIGLSGGIMFVLWLVLLASNWWLERSKEELMKHVLQELEKRGEAPLTESMESIFVKRGISYDKQKEYFAVFERVGLIEIVDGQIKLRKKEQEDANNTRARPMISG